MPELFCASCSTVTFSASNICRDCGREMEPFDPAIHGRSLISGSNGWNQVYKRWKDHPRFKEISQRLNDEGCNGSATHINVFISTLLNDIDG